MSLDGEEDWEHAVGTALARTRDAMLAAAQRVHRDPSSVQLVAVTKALKSPEVVTAAKAGLRVFGENRVQEALTKIRTLSSEQRSHGSQTLLGEPLSWHMIGHLQSNKVNAVVGNFDLIHSVDSLALARSIDARASVLGLSQRILLQVNITGEAQKHGLTPSELHPTVTSIASLKNVRLQGLMTIPPFAEAPTRLRSIFGKLRSLAGELEQEGIPGIDMRELSMGMSDDFEIAIEEGATLVRIGRGLFGARKVAS